MTRRLHLVLERISALFRSQLRDVAGLHDLKLVQLEALIYLSEANRYSDTVGAVAEYLGVTKGTASQTILALERRTLVRKEPDPRDGRVLHCKLTESGAEVVNASYPGEFLPTSNEVEASGTALLRALQTAGSFRTFGLCATCRHFQKSEPGGRCGLTGEDLSDDDTTLICREHAA